MRHPIATPEMLCLASLLVSAVAVAEPAAAPTAVVPTAPLAAATEPGAFTPPPNTSLGDQIAQCLGAMQKTPKTIADLRASAQSCRQARTGLKTPQRTLGPGDQSEVDAAAVEAVKAKEDSVADEVPSFPLFGSNWSLTIEAFLGLTRVTLGSRADGTVDQFATLSGVGSGLKLRYSYVDAKDKVRELVGLSAGLYYEPKAPVTAATGSSTAQTLSAMLVLSSFQYLYLGLGLKFASGEPDFDRGVHARNFMLVFGVGADGKTLAN